MSKELAGIKALFLFKSGESICITRELSPKYLSPATVAAFELWNDWVENLFTLFMELRLAEIPSQHG